MNEKIARPVFTFLALSVSFTAIYVESWRYDPARLEARATKGQPEAEYRLGKAYFDGYVLSKDHKLAATWLAKAAAQGHARAQTDLALMYAKGLGVGQSYTEAAKWYRRAADQNFAVAQNQLGVLYARGRGVARNLDEAIKWFSRASDHNCGTARKNLTMALAARSGSAQSLQYKGKVYSAVKVQKVEPDGLTVSFEPERGGFGVAKLLFAELPAEVQQRYGFSASWSPRESGVTRLTCLAIQQL